jgi:hypothetical protein
MRARASVLLFCLALFPAGPTMAAELFRHGPVVCAGSAPDVTSLTVSHCSWQKSANGGFYSGSCNGSVAIKGQNVQFSVHGVAKRIDYVFPDNNNPLSFNYGGLTCAIQSPRLKSVLNCRSAAKGLTKECQVCAMTAAKVCFNVRLDVAVKTAEVAAENGLAGETVGSISGKQ